MASLNTKVGAVAKDFLSFMSNSPSQFHAVTEVASRLDRAGYTCISESDDWSKHLKAAEGKEGKFYFTRNQSSILAFHLPSAWKPGNGFVVQGAHTDSPVLKLKPISKLVRNGYLQLGVQCYGGGLWNTWFDRDLSLAGRVIVREAGKTDKFKSVLIKVDKPILRIPNLAIHLNRSVNEEGFKFNLEANLVPVLASTIIAELADKQAAGAAAGAGAGATESKTAGKASGEAADHHQQLLALIAKHAGVAVEDVVDFELCLFDTQPPQLGGLYDEFVYSRALDNLCMSYICTTAFINSNAHSKTQCSVLALFDNEEVGSGSTMGAGSNMLGRVLQRINGAETLDAAINKSILVSADMAHGVHPNFADKHEGAHRPVLQGGLVLKENSNQRYATSVATAHFVKTLAAKHSIPIQKFVVRNDVGCGSTIGPILAASCGIRTFDCGVAQWAMHSIRECCGVNDIASSVELLTHFYSDFAELDNNLTIDKK